MMYRHPDEIADNIKALKEEAKLAEQHKQVMDGAMCLRDMYESYIQCGFSEEQAWKILITQIKNLK